MHQAIIDALIAAVGADRYMEFCSCAKADWCHEQLDADSMASMMQQGMDALNEAEGAHYVLMYHMDILEEEMKEGPSTYFCLNDDVELTAEEIVDRIKALDWAKLR